jgi:hypothetical protein
MTTCELVPRSVTATPFVLLVSTAPGQSMVKLISVLMGESRKPPLMQLTMPPFARPEIAMSKLHGALPEQALPVPAAEAYLWVSTCACAGDDNETTAASKANKQTDPNRFMANFLVSSRQNCRQKRNTRVSVRKKEWRRWRTSRHLVAPHRRADIWAGGVHLGSKLRSPHVRSRERHAAAIVAPSGDVVHRRDGNHLICVDALEGSHAAPASFCVRQARVCHSINHCPP